MTSKDKRHEDAADLRERAEEKFRADDAKTKKKLTPLVGRRSEAPAGVDFQGALKETRKMLHELRVHQIELEMQNEELRRAQAKLDAARARYFDLYDLAPVGYCTVSEQGLILEANLTAAKLLGWERKPLVKQPLTSFILNEDQDVYYLHRKQLFESGASQVCELRMLNKEGNHFWARLEAAVAQDADGALVGRVVLSDITERKQVESQKNAALEALQRSEENFRLSLEESPLGVRIATAKGETVYANKALLDIYGYANVEELNKIPIKERYTPQSYAEFHLRKKARDHSDFGPGVYEINIVRKNKEIRHLQVLRKEVLWNGIKKFQVIYQDITERKRAESQREDALAALRESEEKFRKIFEDHAAVKLLIEPESGAIIDANKAAERYYGWTRAELKRMHIQQLNILPAEQVKIEMDKVRKQKRSHFEFRHRRADGSIRDVEVFSSKIEMVGKDILHSIIHDITDRKLAEEALRKSHDRFQLANRATFNPIWDWNLRTDALWWNENFQLLFGYQANEIEPGIESWTSRIHPEDLDRVVKEIHSAIDSGRELWSDQYRFRRKDGSYADISDRGLISRDSNGKPTRMIGAMEDITERKRAEATLRESEERYRSLFENTGTSIIIIEEDTTISFVNEEFARRSGYTRSEIEGVKKWTEIVDREDIERMVAQHQLRRESPGDAQPSYEFRYRTKSGELRYALINVQLLPGTRESMASLIDITERKQAESQREAALAALRESEEKYRTLFTSSSDAIMLIEPISGKFISGNQTMMAMFGLKNDDDFSSFGPWDFSPERQPDGRASAEKAKEMNEIAMRDGSNFFEWSHKRLNGEEFSANVRLTRMVLDKKTILQATVRDITERKQAEGKIKNSLVEKEVLLKEVHHRVKNNLMIIIGLIKMQETKADNKMFNPLMQELEGRIRAMALVHEGLYKSADLAHVNLQNYIEMMSAQIYAQFGANRDIRFSVQAAGVDVNLDSAVPCGLILNELLTNAFKHAFPGDKPRAGEVNCEINVIVNQEDGMNELTVADNGVGLPADLDWEKSEALGLRLIKMLSKQINGSIELDRSAGTTFRLRFAHSSGGK